MKPKTVRRSSGLSSAFAQSHRAGVGPGTVILSQAGETQVEDLRVGARIITRDAGLVTLCGLRKYRLTTHTVRIHANSFGNAGPDRDVILPAEQHVLVRDWRAMALFGQQQALVPAQALVDGSFITNDGVRTLTLFDLRFDCAHVIYADGLEVGALALPAMQNNAC